MKKELEKKLAQEFPDFFVDLYGDKRFTCMAWGLEIGDGWFDLIHKLCKDIQATNPPKDFKFAQIKEKFAGLRAYTDNETREIKKLIDEAEKESFKICEYCGTRENITIEGGWLKALCKNCRSKE